LDINRNRLSPPVSAPSAADLELCRAMDELHLERPYFGSRRMWKGLESSGFGVGRGKVVG
jgi:hypothetical protein